MLVYTDKGWEIERDTYSDELLEKLQSLLPGRNYSFVNELKDKNRGMILLLLEEKKYPKSSIILKKVAAYLIK